MHALYMHVHVHTCPCTCVGLKVQGWVTTPSMIHVVNTTIGEQGWLSPNNEVIMWYSVNFTFCHGHCDRPLDVRGS